jgi:hypothetical protein
MRPAMTLASVPGKESSEVRGSWVSDLGLPQGKARSGADVAATFGPFEDKPARTCVEELAQQARGGHVQERRDTVGLQRGGLGRAAAGDDHARRLHFADHRELGRPDLLRGEAEHARAPRPVRDRLCGCFQQ